MLEHNLLRGRTGQGTREERRGMDGRTEEGLQKYAANINGSSNTESKKGYAGGEEGHLEKMHEGGI